MGVSVTDHIDHDLYERRNDGQHQHHTQHGKWLDITASKFYDWRERYGKVNEHNGRVSRDFWLED